MITVSFADKKRYLEEQLALHQCTTHVPQSGLGWVVFAVNGDTIGGAAAAVVGRDAVHDLRNVGAAAVAKIVRDSELKRRGYVLTPTKFSCLRQVSKEYTSARGPKDLLQLVQVAGLHIVSVVGIDKC
jgi:hypothetical protein